MKKGTSTIPMIMGIIGGVLSLPSAICSGACAAGFTSLVADTDSEIAAAGNTYMGLGIIGGILVLIRE